MTPTQKAPRVQARTGGRGAAERDAAPLSVQGSTLLEARLARGWSQAQAAEIVSEALGATPATWRVLLGDWERGARHPTPERARAVLSAYTAADPERVATLAMLSAIGGHVGLARLIDAHGCEAVRGALAVLVGMVDVVEATRVLPSRAPRRRGRAPGAYLDEP